MTGTRRSSRNGAGGSSNEIAGEFVIERCAGTTAGLDEESIEDLRDRVDLVHIGGETEPGLRLADRNHALDREHVEDGAERGAHCLTGLSEQS